MEQKVCLDTDVVIAILNNEERAVEIIDKIENAEVYITAITLFELLLREKGLEQIEQFREKVKILIFEEEASRKASSIFKELKKKGRMTDIRDIFIAAICVTNQCMLATFNKKHFESIKTLAVVST